LLLPFTQTQEAHSKITRFILICNYVTRVIEPLASRCAKFRFQALPPASMRDRLLTIAAAEGCSEQEVSLVDEILEQADGDMRRAVTTLQSVHSLAVGSQPLSKDIISEIAGLPPVAVMDQLWKTLGADGTAATYDSMQKMVESISADGYSAKLLLSTLLTRVVVDNTLSELDKAELAIRIAEAEKCMMDGADEYLQLLTVCGHALGCFSRSAQGSARQ
jgi:replication factor C subunit 2/4